MSRRGNQSVPVAGPSLASPEASVIAPLATASRMERNLRIAAPVVVALLTLIAFSPALSASFINWDDEMMLRGNPIIAGLSVRHIAAMFSTGYMGHYQPLAWLTLAIDNRLWGLDRPSGFHVTNVVLHACGAVLFYFLARRLLWLAFFPGRDASHDLSPCAFCAAAAAAAMLFAVHPLRVESVAWVTERRDVLSGVFFIAALIAYLRAVAPRHVELRSHAWHLAALLLLTASMLCKAWGLALPGILLVLDVYPLQRLPAAGQSWRSRDSLRVLAQKVPFFLAIVPFAWLAALAQSTAAWGVMSLERYPLSARLAQALYGTAFYPLRTLLPRDLSAIYELPSHPSVFRQPFAFAAIVSIAITVALFALRRRYPAGLAVWICYLLTIAPVLGIAQSGVQFVADRYSYLACLGFPLLAAGGVLEMSRRSKARCAGSYGLAAIVILVLAVLTFRESGYWKDSITLWTKTIRVAPESAIAHVNLANALQSAGDPAAATSVLETAVKLDPRSGMAWQSLGVACCALRRFPEGERAFQRAQRYFVDPRETDLELALLYLRWEKPDQAVPLLESSAQAARLRPRALAYLGALHRHQKQFERAIRELEEASALDPALAAQVWPELELARQRR